MKIFALLLPLCWLAGAQPKPVSTQTSGSCSPILAGNSNTVTLTCNGVDKKLADEISQIIAASKRDDKTLASVLERLNAILSEVRRQPSTSVTSSNQQGGVTTGQFTFSGPGTLIAGGNNTIRVNARIRLSDQQKQYFASQIRQFSQFHDDSLITAALGDSQSIALGEDFAEAFRSAGWEAKGISQAIYSKMPTGIIIQLHSVEDSEQPLIKTIITLLAEFGLRRSGDIVASVPAGQFRLIIGAMD